MRGLRIVCAVSVLAACASPQPRSSERKFTIRPSATRLARPVARHALVIGNAAYVHGDARLANPVNDARAVAAALERLGFDSVQVREDLGRAQLRDAVAGFVDALGKDDLALVFYAGHGIGIGGANYLLPVDFSAASPEDASDDAYPVETLATRLSSNRRGINLVILDACRNDPFSRAWTRTAAGKGFAEPRHLDDTTILWFSTSPGDIARDGVGAERNSPFAAALVQALETSGRSPFWELFQGVKAEVVRRTGGEQRPWKYDQLDRRFDLGGRVQSAADIAARRPVARSQGPRSRALILAGYQFRIGDTAQGPGRGVDQEIVAMSNAYEVLGFEDIRVQRNQQIDRKGIVAAMGALIRDSRAGDRVAIHLGGMSLALPGASEVDGDDEAFIPYGLTIDADQKADARHYVLDDELRTWVAQIRRQVGPSGQVLFTGTCAHDDMTDGGGGRSPALAPLVVLEPAVMGFEDERGVGTLAAGFANAVQNLGAEVSWEVAIGEIERTSGAGVSAYGDLGRSMRTGRWVPHGGFLGVAGSMRYGPRTVFLDGGHLAGVFTGSEIGFYEPQAFPPAAETRMRGLVVQSGLDWARVELAPGVDADKARSGLALVERRAMPPVRVRIDIQPSARAFRMQLDELLAPLQSGPGPPDLHLRIGGETNYVHVHGVNDAQMASGPFAVDDDRFGDRLTDHIWRLAFTRWLLRLPAPADKIVCVAADGQTAARTDSCPTAPLSWVKGQSAPFAVWQRSAPGRRPKAHVGTLPESMDLRARGLLLVKTTSYLTIIVPDDGVIEGATAGQSERLFHVPQRGGGVTVRSYALTPPRDLPLPRLVASWALDRPRPAVATRAEELPLGEVDPDTARRMQDLRIVAGGTARADVTRAVERFERLQSR